MSKGQRNRAKRQNQLPLKVANQIHKAASKEVAHLMAEATERFYKNEVAVILWELHQTFGFGKDRLRRFYDNYDPAWKALRDHYELTDAEVEFVVVQQLRDIGVDLEEWERGANDD